MNMASSAKKRTRGSKASNAKRKRKNSGSEEDQPPYLSSKYAEPPTSKIYNSRSQHNKPDELFRKDLISAMKLPDSEVLAPDDYWLITDPWRSEWERGVQVPVYPDALPEPEVRILRKKSKESAFKLPKKLIRFTRNNFFNPEIHDMSYTNTLAERTCRYDMDDFDLGWLTVVNEEREDFGLQPLEESIFEQIIEELEVQSYTNFQEVIKSEEGLGVEYDEDAICDVCRSPDSVEGNIMVFCDSCNICVHQICYGITKIPEGSWLCRTCALGIRPACVLCPNRGGAMKTTRCGQQWGHVSCAVWIPEVSFLNFSKMEPITKVSHIPASRWTLPCSICKQRVGACIQCSEKNCKVAFHVTCAFQEGLQMKASVKLSDADDDKLEVRIDTVVFCQKHSKKSRGFLIDSEEDGNILNTIKKEALTSEERANIRQQKIQAKEAEFYNYVNLDDVADLFEIPKTVIEIIFHYWKLKRRANWNRALLPPKINNDDNCTEEDAPFVFLKKAVHLRRDLERVRNLSYMTLKREKLSLKWMTQKECIFMNQVRLIDDKSSQFNEDEIAAIKNANFGDMAYDKKHTGINGPSPNVVNVLTTLVGEEYVKTHFSFAMKSARKSDRVKSEKTSNPYAKHYLNGLAVRSQRYLNKQKSISGLQNSLDANASLNCSFQNASGPLHSDDGCDSSKDLHDSKFDPKFISQSDPKFECFNTNDNDFVSLETYHNDIHNMKTETISCESKVQNDTLYELLSYCQSSNDSTFASSVDVSALSIDESVSDSDLKNKLKSDNCTVNFNEYEVKFEKSDTSIAEKESVSSNQKYLHKTAKTKGSGSEKLNNSIIPLEDASKLSSSEQNIDLFCNDIVNIKLELPVENCIDVISMDTAATIEVSDDSISKDIPYNKPKIENEIDLLSDDKLNSPVHCVIVKSDISLLPTKIECVSPSVKSSELIETCDKPIKIETCEITPDPENNRDSNDKSSSNSIVLAKDKDIKIRPSPNKGSLLRTQSPTFKTVENGVLKGIKSNAKQNSDKSVTFSKSHSKSKSSLHSHPMSPLVNKSHSSSVNKCQEKNSSATNKTVDSESSELKDSSVTPVPRKDMLRGYKIPKKARTEKPEENSLDIKRGNTPLSPLPDITSSSVSGYHTKGRFEGSWRKLEPRTKDNSSSNSRTNVNGTIQNDSAERLVLKLKKDTTDPQSQRWKTDLNNHNNFNRNMFNYMGPPLPPRLLRPPMHPSFHIQDSHIPVAPHRPWHRMRMRGGFRQVHMGYSNSYT